MSIIQPTGPSSAKDPLAAHEVGGMLERMDAQGQVTERLLLSLGDWQVIPDDQGKLRVLEAMHVTPKPALLRLRVWRSRIGVAWQTGSLVPPSDGLGAGQGKSFEAVAEKQKLIDCETDLQWGGERFRLIPSQQTIQTSGTPPVPQDTTSEANSYTPTEQPASEKLWKEAVKSLTRSMETIQTMVERWYGEPQQMGDPELSRERLRSLSSQLAFCRNQCETLGALRLSEVTVTGDKWGKEHASRPQPSILEVDGELEEAKHAALGLWTSLCADPIELRVDSLPDGLEPEADQSWEAQVDRWESYDSSTDWQAAQEPKGVLVQIEHPEKGELGEEESRAALQAEARREESMREWLQGHFEGRHEEYMLLEQLLFQQPSRRGADVGGDSESTNHRTSVASEREGAQGSQQQEGQASADRYGSTAAVRADRIAVLFGCVLIIGGIGMWNLNLAAWNSKFAGVVAGVIGSLWLVDSIFRLRAADHASTSSNEA